MIQHDSILFIIYAIKGRHHAAIFINIFEMAELVEDMSEWSGGRGGSKIIDVGFNFNTGWLKR